MKSEKKVKLFKDFEWIDLTNPTNKELSEITSSLELDVNLLEDSIEHGHLPKLEKVNDYTFIILRAYSAHDKENVTSITQLSNKIAFFFNKKQLITIHRTPFHFLDTDYDSKSTEALALDIMNDMLQTFEQPIETQNSKTDLYEKRILLQQASNISVEDLYFQKAKARVSKKVLAMTQNVLHQLVVAKGNETKLQDLKDTVVNHLLMYDEIIENVSALFNSYLAIKAQKNNDVMKLLTVFSAFFLPLTFIVGVYGMNFDIMPELRHPLGYFYVWGFMIVLSILIYIWFKRKNIL
jgi:magnesium transporter